MLNVFKEHLENTEINLKPSVINHSVFSKETTRKQQFILQHFQLAPILPKARQTARYLYHQNCKY